MAEGGRVSMPRWARREIASAGKVIGIVLTVVATAAGALWTVAQAYASKSAEYATDAEVAAEIAKVRAIPRIPSAPEKSAIEAYEKSLTALDADRQIHTQVLLAVLHNQIEEGAWKARILGSDLEPDHRRKMEAADEAEDEYRNAIDAQRAALAKRADAAAFTDAGLDITAALRTATRKRYRGGIPR